MTKTETKRLVADIRRNAALVANVVSNPQAWDANRSREVIEEALNNIDGLSAMLREGWVD